MSKKSNASNVVSTAKRLAPLTASLLALCVIAACARTNGGKASISKETPEAQVESMLQKTGNGDFSGKKFLPENMALSAKIAGAEITKAANRGDDKGIDIELGLVMTDLDQEIVAVGRANPLGGALNYSKEAVPKYLLAAKCGGDHCDQLTVSVVEQAEEPVTMTASSEMHAVDGSTATTPEKASSTGAPIEDAVTPAVLPSDVPVSEKKIVAKAESRLVFGIKKLAEGAKETDEEKTARQNTYVLVWKSPTDASTMIKQHYNDLKEGRLLKKGMTQAQIDTERAAADAKTKADADAAKAATEKDDESGDDKPVTGGVPAAPKAAKPAAPTAPADDKAVVVSPVKPVPVSTSAPVIKPVAKPVATAPAPTVAKPVATTTTTTTTTTPVAKPVATTVAAPAAKPVAAKTAPVSAAPAATTPVASNAPATLVAPAAAAPANLTPAQKAEAARVAAKKTAIAAAAADYNAKLLVYKAAAEKLATAKDAKSKSAASTATLKATADMRAATAALAKAKAA